MAVKMSQDLGLQGNIDLYPNNEYERNRRRTTLDGLVQLHNAANSCMLFPFASFVSPH